MRTDLLIGVAAAFFGGFFAYSFDQLAKWMGDQAERRRRNKNALVKLERTYAVQLNTVSDNIHIADWMKSTLEKTSETSPALSFNTFHHIASNEDVLLDLMNVDFVNAAFSSHIGIVKLNHSTESLNRFYTELKTSLLAKDISSLNYQENISNLVANLSAIRAVLERTESEIQHLTGYVRVLLMRKHWLDNLSPSLRENIDESIRRQAAEQVAQLQKEIRERAPARMLATLMENESANTAKLQVGGRVVQISRCVNQLFHLDTNRINSKQGLLNINRLEKWQKDGVILMELSSTARDECTTDPGSKRTEKANEYLYAIPADRARDQKLLEQIGNIIFPGGPKSDDQKKDALIVYTAAYYNAILVTADGNSKKQPRGILGSQADLRAIGVRVMTDEEAVRHVEALVADRDAPIRLVCTRTGQPLPDWVGKD
jgi:hypothetical protein